MDQEAKKQALRRVPYGLYVVGVVDGDYMTGFTATWFSQCSFEPPLVVVSVRADSKSNPVIKSGKVFTVNFLDQTQAEIAKQFFKSPERVGDKLGDVAIRIGLTGAPVLVDALAFLECHVVEVVERGDHHLVIGEVVEAGVCREGEVLALADTNWSYGG